MQDPGSAGSAAGLYCLLPPLPPFLTPNPFTLCPLQPLPPSRLPAPSPAALAPSGRTPHQGLHRLWRLVAMPSHGPFYGGPRGGGGGALGRIEDGGVGTAEKIKRPPQQPTQPQYANCWAPLTCKWHILPHPAQPQHTNHWAPRTRKRHQQEHRPQRPTESLDPTQHAKGRTGDCPGPHKETTTRRNLTQGAGEGFCYQPSHGCRKVPGARCVLCNGVRCRPCAVKTTLGHGPAGNTSHCPPCVTCGNIFDTALLFSKCSECHGDSKCGIPIGRGIACTFVSRGGQSRCIELFGVCSCGDKTSRTLKRLRPLRRPSYGKVKERLKNVWRLFGFDVLMAVSFMLVPNAVPYCHTSDPANSLLRPLCCRYRHLRAPGLDAPCAGLCAGARPGEVACDPGERHHGDAGLRGNVQVILPCRTTITLPPSL